MKLIKLKVAAFATVLVLGGAALPSLVRVLADPVSLNQPAGTQTIILQHTAPLSILKLAHWDHSANLPAGVTQIQPLPAQNALSVTATSAGLARVREIIKTLDIEPRQVQIKFALASSLDADLKASGIKFEVAPLDEPDLKPMFVIYATGSPAAQFLQTLTKQGAVTLGPDVTTTNNVGASVNISTTFSEKKVDSLIFAATPRINGDDSVTLALHPVISVGGVTHEVNTLRTVKKGDTVIIVMLSAASQADGKNLLLFVTPTVK